MKTALKWILVTLALALLLPACGRTVTQGARALLPLQSQDTARVWIYLDTNDQRRDGVYRCIDNGTQIVCAKAQLTGS